jgi:hypothetical protein
MTVHPDHNAGTPLHASSQVRVSLGKDNTIADVEKL